MIEILHYNLKGPKPWELWSVPHYGKCRVYVYHQPQHPAQTPTEAAHEPCAPALKTHEYLDLGYVWPFDAVDHRFINQRSRKSYSTQALKGMGFNNHGSPPRSRDKVM